MRIVTLARKPLAASVAANALKYGSGALNIQETRIAHSSPADLASHQAMVQAIKTRGGVMGNSWKNVSDLSNANDVSTAGRWPPNMILQHLTGCSETCAPGCPVVELNAQNPDPEGVSRFFKQV